MTQGVAIGPEEVSLKLGICPRGVGHVANVEVEIQRAFGSRHILAHGLMHESLVLRSGPGITYHPHPRWESVPDAGVGLEAVVRARPGERLFTFVNGIRILAGRGEPGNGRFILHAPFRGLRQALFPLGRPRKDLVPSTEPYLLELSAGVAHPRRLHRPVCSPDDRDPLLVGQLEVRSPRNAGLANRSKQQGGKQDQLVKRSRRHRMQGY